MNDRYVKLGDVCNKESSSIAQKDLDGHVGAYPIYGASGLIAYVEFYQQEKEYIAIVKDGAGVGRTMLLPAKSSVIGTLQYIIPDVEQIDIRYLYFAIVHMELGRYFTGATIPHIYFRDYQKESFKLPSLSRQKSVADILQLTDRVIERRQKQLALLDDLVKSRFIEMFGDPSQNPMRWKTVSLLELGTCKNGMNFHTDDTGVDVHCLGVGNFKDFSRIDNTELLPTVSLNEMPADDYLLQDGDIVFVRSNGNKALVGRSLAIYPHDIPTTFSGFCIRFRLTTSIVTTEYLLRALKTESMRKKMAGRGANIQNLNQQILASLVIPIPPA